MAKPNTDITERSIVVATSNQVSSQLGEEAVILHLADGMYYGLDPVGSEIWQLAQRPISVEEIAATVQEKYEVGAEQCLQDILALLIEMASKDLIEIQH